MKTIGILALFALLGHSPWVYACGYCAGDKSASVYSFKNKQFAERTHSQYVSVELTSPGDEDEFNRAVESLKNMDGVYKETFRAAYSQRAVSFVFKPKIKFEDLARAFSQSQKGRSIKLVEEIK